jgi:hypothetical protein
LKNNILYNKINVGKNSSKISKTKLFDEKLNKEFVLLINEFRLAEIHRTLSVDSDVDFVAQIVKVGNNSFSDSHIRTASRRVGLGVVSRTNNMSAVVLGCQMGVIYRRWY